MVDQLPRMLADRYEVGRLIGRGGMAQVYIAYDTRLSRTVAIKILRSDMATDDTFLARFRREAQSSAALNHPSIVAVYDTGEEEIETGTGKVNLPFIVMEYVNGQTVRDLLADGDPIPIDEAAHVAAGVLSALEYSHREGIIHRDIKPGNIMLTQDGTVKVMDFGIARALADAHSTVTQTNTVVGTAQYLSPEQARGEVVDTRSDLYSAGCLLYEMLVGKPPFTGDSAVAVAYQHVSEVPLPPSSITADIPDSIDRVVLKSLAKNRDDRYQTAAQFRSDLLNAVRGGAVTAPATTAYAVPAPIPTPLPTAAYAPGQVPSAVSAHTGNYPPYETGQFPAHQKKSKNGWLWGIIILLLLVLAGFGLYQVLGNNGSDEGPTPTVTMVDVPNLEGLNQSEVRAALAEDNLELIIGDPVESDEVDEGLFVSSDPPVGTSVEEGSSVTVSFSAGVGEVTVPDVTGMDADAARRTIEAEGLVWGSQTTEDNHPDFDEGEVISTDPTANTSVPRGTPVNVKVSSGRVSVPNLVGMNVDIATAELNNLNLSYRIEFEESEETPDTIIRQNYPEGASVATGEQIVITVAEEPAPTEDPTTEEPTEDPTEEPTEDPTDDPTPDPTDTPPSNDPSTGPPNE
ncbi:Stk1 family PASTA domain-containing Ser/Thr kinase [Flaviflexus massiliensis]|uniref:Stk1 family PASTA domain-containing Ser/Thr kinase n=1 Tax=Flaviflexus massiliensis TaxID=1522309 RepID=UPI0006D57852|nr:Stk1 family PASTA domain-containing Ser/Thr kinase [Flaviflexus massiliensis]